MKKHTFEEKLKLYGSLAVGILAVPTQAQVIYNDISPDVQVGDTAQFEFDINLDGYLDFTVFQGIGFDFDSNRVSDMVGISREAGCEILGSLGGDYFYPFALNFNDTIRATSPDFHNNDFGTFNYQGVNAYGNWQGVEDKFVGIKITKDGKDYLGWARLDIAANARSFVVKDYAFMSEPGKDIIAGDGLNGLNVMNLGVRDTADNNNGSDIFVHFDQASLESELSEYRLLVVPYATAAGFTVDSALKIPATNYTSIAGSGKSVDMILDANAMDIAGNPIKIATFYRIYVLSVPLKSSSTKPMLSTSNRAISILHIPSVPVTVVTAKDVDNNGDGRDLEISFQKATDESKVGQYWVFTVKAAKADHFNLAAAAMVNPAFTDKIDKTGSDIQTVLKGYSKDTDGDRIKDGVKYKVFIASLADGVNASLHVLSEPSAEVELHNTSSVNDLIDDLDVNFFNNVITIEPASLQHINLMLFDLQGKIVLDKKTNGKTSISLNHLPAGIYILKLNSGNQVYRRKVEVR